MPGQSVICLKKRFTKNGIVQNVVICVGGAFVFYFVRLMFCFGVSRPGMNAIAASASALVIVPFHWRKQARSTARILRVCHLLHPLGG